MTRRGLIVTLSVIVLVAIGLFFVRMIAEPEPQLKMREVVEVPETKQQQAPPPKQEPRQVPVQREVQQPQTQVIQQPQDPSEDPGRPQQAQPEPSPEELEPHTRAVGDISALREKLDDYKSRMGEYPATVDGLRALGGTLPKDRWGHDYIYNSPSTRNRESYDLFSVGSDGRPDTPDDDWGELSEEDNPGNQ